MNEQKKAEIHIRIYIFTTKKDHSRKPERVAVDVRQRHGLKCPASTGDYMALVCSKSKRLLKISNCFCFETYLGSLRSTTGGPPVVGSSISLAVPDAFELSGKKHSAAAATEEREAHESGMKFVSV